MSRPSSSWCGRLGAQSLRQQSFHLAVFRESPGPPLGEEDFSLELDFEVAVATLDEPGLDREALLNVIRQTGGSWQVVSNHAIFDGDRCHGSSPGRNLVCSRDYTRGEIKSCVG